MINLPLELLHHICSQAGRDELATLRLINRSICQIATEYLFEEITLFVHRTSYRNLLRISQRPYLARHVKKLVYHNLFLNDTITSFEKWKHDELSWHRLHVTSSSTSSYQPSHKNMRNRYRNFKRALASQRKMWKSNLDHGYLTKALLNLPNLKRVCLSSGFWFTMGHRPKLAQKIITDRFHTTPTTGDSREMDRPEALRAVFGMLIACSQRDAYLDEFSAGTMSWLLFKFAVDNETHDEITPFEPENVISIFDCLRFITKLNLAIDTGSDDRSESPYFNQIGTEADHCRHTFARSTIPCQILGTMQHLRELTFQFSILYGCLGIAPGRLRDVVGRNTWPKLESLQIGGMDSSQEDLLGLLRRHKATLRNFRIESLELWGEASWLDVLPEIRNTLSLESCFITGDITTRFGDETRMSAYDEPDGDQEHWVKEAWVIEPWVENNHNLYDRLAVYMIQGGEFPLTLDNMGCHDDMP